MISLIEKKAGESMENDITQNTTDKTLEAVKKALGEIKYSEIIIKMQDGKPVWVDKYERESSSLKHIRWRDINELYCRFNW